MNPDNPYREPQSSRKSQTEQPDEKTSRRKQFTRSAHHTLKVTGFCLTGVFSVATALVMFVVHTFLLRTNNQLSLHTTTTLPLIGGTFLLGQAWHLMKTPRSVGVFREGLAINRSQTRLIRWEDIHFVVNEEANGLNGTAIRLNDANDKLIERITGLEHLEELGQVVRKVVDSRTTTEKPPLEIPTPGKATAIHRRRGRMRAIGFGFASLFTVAGCAFMVYEANWMKYSQQQMADHSITGTGIVSERKLAPNGITKRLYVDVPGAEGTSETHNFEVTDEFFAASEEGNPVEIRYVPADPRIAELLVGQVKDDDPLKSVGGSWAMAFAFVVMTGLFGTMSVLSWFGYDIKFDKNHKGLVPIGE